MFMRIALSWVFAAGAFQAAAAQGPNADGLALSNEVLAQELAVPIEEVLAVHPA